VIETNDLSKQFNDFLAVDGVTITVKPGEILALLGQNGAGKTTTVRMLTALLSPTRGTARVGGYDVQTQARHVREVVGVLTEQHGLYARMTGREYLDFFGELHGLRREARRLRGDYLLEYFGLAATATQRIGEYSKGMRQKLALARALVHEPSVLLLDEPTSAMDPESSRLVRNEISRLRSSQRTIVICTHNLAEAELLADTVAIIYRGRILLTGTLEALKLGVMGNPEYEARFASPWDSANFKAPPGVTVTQLGELSLRFSVEHPNESNPPLLQEFASLHAPLVALQEVPRSLEEVYLRIMAEAQTTASQVRDA
jgi:ABC-2 type transport system ATP-binding protein